MQKSNKRRYCQGDTPEMIQHCLQCERETCNNCIANGGAAWVPFSELGRARHTKVRLEAEKFCRYWNNPGFRQVDIGAQLNVSGRTISTIAKAVGLDTGKPYGTGTAGRTYVTIPLLRELDPNHERFIFKEDTV